MHAGALVGGAYRLVYPVGKGGMGTVWAAERADNQAPVAIKLLTTGASDEMQKRLLREAEAAGRLKNEHVVNVLDVGRTDSGEPFLVMELLEGQTLRSVIKRERRLDQRLAATIIRDICLALQAAHAGNIVHRDLKPSNVILHETPKGIVVKVLDFGVSKVLAEEQQLVTSTGIAVGSPAYMSPEQARGARVDHRADLWSIGVLLFELVTGRRPFAADSPAAMLSMILFSDIPKASQFCADLHRDLEALISHCLQRKVSDRIQTAQEIIAVLEPFVLPEVVVPVRRGGGREGATTSTNSTSLPTNDELTASASASAAVAQSSSSPSAHSTTASTSHSTTHGVAMTPAPPLPALPPPRTGILYTRLQWVAACLAILLLGSVSALILLRAVKDSNSRAAAAASAALPPAEATPVPTAAPTPNTPSVAVVTGKPASSADEPEATTTQDAQGTKEAPKPTTSERADRPAATTTRTAAAPKPAPQNTAPPSARTSRPSTSPKPCASPIVDANGKVVGCL
ncbi:MAG: serine/threonine-protein kinase [Polyangiaceae bacterium]